MRAIEATSSQFWIIGYGNPQRRDDGIGPYVAGRVDKSLKHRKGIRILILHQLEPDLVEELRHASAIILVDAAINDLKGGWQWIKVEPELRDFHYLTHHFKPSFLLGLLQSLYQKCPQTWLISVQGDNFEFGEGLTPGAEKRAQRVVSEITKFILSKNY